MILRFIIYSCLLIICAEGWKQPICLTGYMTDVQTWVDEKGVLTNNVDLHTAIDLSANTDPMPVLQQKINSLRSESEVKFLSMARCRLNSIPSVFQFHDSQGRDLSDTVQYMTFFGNNFHDISSAGDQYDVSINATRARERIIGVGYQRSSNAVWSTGLKETKFPQLKELDLRACSIQVLSAYIFQGMRNLEALYLGENEIIYVDADSFVGLNNLIHLDFSRNEAYDDTGNLNFLSTETYFIFEPLGNLASLDFSFTKLSQGHTHLFEILGPKMTRLSLCETGLSDLNEDFFNRTSLKILDVSGNNGILNKMHVLRGLEDKLEVFYAKEIGLRTTQIFQGFHKLEILAISMNEINIVSSEVTKTLTNLRILDLEKNRISTWFNSTFHLIPQLQMLTLNENNINLISDEMLKDIKNINYIALAGNFLVCNCFSRDLFDIALKNEKNYAFKDILREKVDLKISPAIISYHRGYNEFNEKVLHRIPVSVNCTKDTYCTEDSLDDLEGNFVLLDYHSSTYMCLMLPKSKPVAFSEVIGCNKSERDIDYNTILSNGMNYLYVLLLIPAMLISLAVGYIFRRNFRYFFITLRNSALLSVINKHEVLNEDAIFHYDVFVSYCNDDRHWVLDYLLPHLETECSISACLHERDFQVGHSILENIVSCMDRSRSIMLIISQRFLLSQWCQFEMHLAQHRLLETRREDLTIVLLEDIPRRLRPNTLHYLMLTKTYILWPKYENERVLFWKRLKKTLVTIKLKQTAMQGVSLA